MVDRCPSLLVAVLSLGVLPLTLQADPDSIGLLEFPKERAALIEASQAFFDAVETEKAKPNAAPVIGWAVNATRSYDAPDDVAVLTKMGPVQHLTGYQITWYPTDKLLGTVDFMGTWDGNRNLVCGYVTWDFSTRGAPEIQSISASFISPDVLKQSETDDVHRTLIASNCAYGTIEANIKFFDGPVEG